MKEKWNRLLQDKRSGTVLFLVALVLLVLVLLIPGEKKSSKQTADPAMLTDNGSGERDSSYEETMERRLEAILQNISGAGKVEVMLTLKESEERVVKEDGSSSQERLEESDSNGGSRVSISRSDSKDTVFSGEEPFVVKSIEPQPEGILVLADGGDSPGVVSEIHSALMALFDLPSHKIQVLKRVSGK